MNQRVLVVDLPHRSHRTVEMPTPEPLLAASVSLLPVLLPYVGEDVVIIGRGPLAGYDGVGLATAHFTCVSPQSGGLVEAKVEGPLGHALRGLGLDALVVLGRSPQLVGLRLRAGADVDVDVVFEDAREAAGMSVWETTRIARRGTAGTAGTAVCIGPSGELQQPCASVVVDDGFPTTMGGVGAVFGRMKVKFLHLPDSPTATTPDLERVTASYVGGMASNPLAMTQHENPGFGIYVDPALVGSLAGGGFAPELPESVAEFHREDFRALLRHDGDGTCPGCPQRCLKSFLPEDAAAPVDGGRVHQLGITAFASQWGDPVAERAARFNSYCHEIGAEHLYAAALLMQEQPARDDSVEGLVSSVLPHRLTTAFLQVKGMAIPPFDPRGNQGLGVAMALNPGGPRYDVVEHDIDFDPTMSWERHARFGVELGLPVGGLPLGTLTSERFPGLVGLWSLWSGLDALGVCLFASPPTRELRTAQVLDMAQSLCASAPRLPDLLELGRVRLALQRHTNHLLEVDSSTDTLPDRFFSEAAGRYALQRDDFERARAAVTTAFSWEPGGGLDRDSALWHRTSSLLAAVDEGVRQWGLGPA